MTSNRPSSNNKEWTPIRKVGEGVTGVVYLVEVDNGKAILKQPAPSILDAQRQAPQIVHEGNILEALQSAQDLIEGLPLKFTNVIARSQATDGVEKCFLLMERAQGFSLTELAKVAKFGLYNSGIHFDELSRSEKLFLRTIETHKLVPNLVILKTLDALLGLLPRIHNHQFYANGEQKYGIVWNDVKPDHLYWDINTQAVTLIDWGNSQFLEKDGITRDRKFSSDNDNRQFIEEIGKFLEENNPGLKSELGWSSYIDDISSLHSTIQGAVRSNQSRLLATRAQENAIIQLKQIDIEKLKQLQDFHERIFLFGQVPNYEQTTALIRESMATLPKQLAFDKLGKLALWPIRKEYPDINEEEWTLLASLVEIAKKQNDQDILTMLENAIKGNWPETFLGLCQWALKPDTEGTPDWWREIRPRLRQYVLGLYSSDFVEDEPLKAFQNAKRILKRDDKDPETLQLLGKIIANWEQSTSHLGSEFSGLHYNQEKLLIQEHLIGENSVVLKNADITFQDIRQSLLNAIFIPNELALQALEAWKERDFESVEQLLIQLLVWDPDRRRLVDIWTELKKVDYWIDVLHTKVSDKNRENVPRLIETGKNFINTIGNASWISQYMSLLEALKNKGEKDLLFDFAQGNPPLRDEFPWLELYYQSKILENLRATLSNFYSNLRKKKWNTAEEVCDDESLVDWKPAYLNLVRILRQQDNFSEVIFEQNISQQYAPVDSWYKETENIINFVNEWLHALRSKSLVEANNVLEGFQPEYSWKLIEEIREIQKELNEKQLLINYLKDSYWEGALEQIEGNQKYELLDHAIRNFNRAKSVWIGKRGSPLDNIEKIIIPHYKSGLNHYEQWIQPNTIHVDSDIDQLELKLADWKRIKDKITEVIFLGKEIIQEAANWSNLRERGYATHDIEKAKEYLDTFQRFEAGIYSDPNHAQAPSWIKSFNLTVNQRRRNTIEPSNPLYHWLTKFPQNKRIKILPLAFATALVIICIAGIVSFSKIAVLVNDRFGVAIPTQLSLKFNASSPTPIPTVVITTPAENTQPIPTSTPPPTAVIISPAENIPIPEIKACNALLQEPKDSIEQYIQGLSLDDYENLLASCESKENQWKISDIHLRQAISESSFDATSAYDNSVRTDYKILNGNNEALLPQGEGLIRYEAQWLRATLALCRLGSGPSLIDDARHEILSKYLDWHLAQYGDEGRSFFTEVCGFSPDDLLERIKDPTGNIRVVTFSPDVSSWPETLNCLYTDENKTARLYWEIPLDRYEFSSCLMPNQEATVDPEKPLAGFRIKFGSINLPESPQFGYGFSFTQNSRGVMIRAEQDPITLGAREKVVLYQVDNLELNDIAETSSFVDGSHYQQTLSSSDQCGSNKVTFRTVIIEDLLIWRFGNNPSEEKTLGLLAGVLESPVTEEIPKIGVAPWLDTYQPVEAAIKLCFEENVFEQEEEK
jgi:serine/threonine protein kinase